MKAFNTLLDLMPVTVKLEISGKSIQFDAYYEPSTGKVFFDRNKTMEIGYEEKG